MDVVIPNSPWMRLQATLKYWAYENQTRTGKATEQPTSAARCTQSRVRLGDRNTGRCLTVIHWFTVQPKALMVRILHVRGLIRQIIKAGMVFCGSLLQADVAGYPVRHLHPEISA